ncbi:MAG: hypothetical protein H0Z39_06960 [Peptococcaceae bacterium]|nr:hypothetical protein [Peptococcaceae bacterium]
MAEAYRRHLAYRRLARAIVSQAVRDVLRPVKVNARDWPVWYIRADARRFLRNGAEKDGHECCVFELAGICPRQVLKAIEGGNIRVDRRGYRQHRSKCKPGAGAQVRHIAEKVPGAGGAAGVFCEQGRDADAAEGRAVSPRG